MSLLKAFVRTTFLVLSVVFFAALPAMAEQDLKKTEKRTAEEEKQVIEMRKRSAEKRKDLNGSRWEVSFLSSSDPKLKGKEDVFVFQDGVFSSEAFVKRGFTPTNYSITVPMDDKSETGVWETMQAGKDGLIFIRGEWTKDSMSGDITEQLQDGKVVLSHRFKTISRKAISTESSKSGASKGEEKVPEGASNQKALVSKEDDKEVASFLTGTTQESS